MEKLSEKKEKILPPHTQEIPCREVPAKFITETPGKTPFQYDALPRDCKFAYMTPGYYAVGFRILDVYKEEVDLTATKSLMFLEDSEQSHKWGILKQRIPFPEGRMTDLPGTRVLHYNNYYMRSLTPESAMSWRKSISRK